MTYNTKLYERSRTLPTNANKYAKEAQHEPMDQLTRYEKGEMTAHMNLIAEFAAHIGCTLSTCDEYETLRMAA